MLFFALTARSTKPARCKVPEASKKISLDLSPSAESSSVVNFSGLPPMPCASARPRSLFSLRPVRIGSGIRRRSSETRTPPCFMMARTERIRCWLVPMRPVTPLRMMPILRVSMFRFLAESKSLKRHASVDVQDLSGCVAQLPAREDRDGAADIFRRAPPLLHRQPFGDELVV